MRTTARTRQIEVSALAVVTTLAIGTVGFRWALGEPWTQSFYRAVVTASLTGLDTVPRNDSARAISIFMVAAGLTIIAYLGAVIVEAIASGVLTGVLAERRRQRTIEQLEDHFIICGYGRVGRRVAEEFRASGVAYVVLDFSPQAVVAAREHGDLFIEGNAAEDEDLDRAGLRRARGLVAAADDDAENLYIVLSARNTRPDVFIVARGSDEEAEKKLKLAGADRVVLPYANAGRVMASLAVRPQVGAFLDIVSTATGPGLQFEELEVTPESHQAGRSIRDLKIRDATGAIVVALRKRDGTFDATPEPDTQIDAGDVLIAVGTSDELQRLEGLFAARDTVAG